MTKAQKAEMMKQAYADIEILRGKEVGVIITNVSKSGMSRQMKFYADGFQNVTRAIATITENRYNDKNGTLSVSGCGMDMVFAVLSSLNYKMAQYDTGKTLQELHKTGECGERIYDKYFVNANHYRLL